MFNRFGQGIERNIMANKRRGVIEVLRNTCAAGGTILHLKIAPSKPHVEPANTRRQRVKINLRLWKCIHDFASELLDLLRNLHRVVPNFRNSVSKVFFGISRKITNPPSSLMLMRW